MNDESVQTTVDSADTIMIGISHKSMKLKKNGPKTKNALGKAVKVAIFNKSSKESIVELKKKYEWPENCNLIKVPSVNKEIWDAMNEQAHSDDLNLQVINKYSGNCNDTFQLVQTADMLVNKRSLNPIHNKG